MDIYPPKKQSSRITRVIIKIRDNQPFISSPPQTKGLDKPARQLGKGQSQVATSPHAERAFRGTPQRPHGTVPSSGARPRSGGESGGRGGHGQAPCWTHAEGFGGTDGGDLMENSRSREVGIKRCFPFGKIEQMLEVIPGQQISEGLMCSTWHDVIWCILVCDLVQYAGMQQNSLDIHIHTWNTFWTSKSSLWSGFVVAVETDFQGAWYEAVGWWNDAVKKVKVVAVRSKQINCVWRHPPNKTHQKQVYVGWMTCRIRD